MNIYPLTTPQQNIKNLMDVYPDTAIANQCGAILFTEKRDLKRLGNAIITAIARMDSLRLRLTSDGSGQYLSEETLEQIEVLNFASEKELDVFAGKAASDPIYSVDAPLYRFYLVQVGEKTGVLTVLHHLIADAWTFGLLAHTVDLLYRGETLPELHSYMEFIRSEGVYRSSGRIEKDRLFWEKRYTSAPERTPIKLTGSNHGIVTKRYQAILSDEVELSLKRACEGCKATPAVILETVVLIYLMKINRENASVTIGTPVLNRTNVKEKQTAGMFISTMPLTVQADRDRTAAELAKTVTSMHFSIFRHQRYPYVGITEYVREHYGFTGNFYDVMVSYQNAVTGTEARTKWYENGYSEVPLVLHFDDRDGTGNHTVTIDYQTAVFNNELEISLFLARLEHILMQIAADPERLIEGVSLLPESEKKLLIEEFNDTYVEFPRNKCVHELFMEQVLKTPDKAALVFEKRSFTYRELDEMSNSLAHFLRRKGVGRNDIVPLIARRDWRVIVAMLGILKVGGAYMPVSPDYPSERIETMIRIAESRIALHYGYDRRLPIEGVDLNGFDFAFNNAPIDNINESEDLCYIIFTSGSTGEPKGVCICHRNVVNYIHRNENNVMRSIIHDEYQVIVSVTNIIFDIFVTESIMPILNGMTIYLANEEESVLQNMIAALIAKNDVEILQTTPTKMRSYLMDRRNLGFLRGLKTIILGGEVLPPDLYEELRGLTDAQVFNIYGPAETTVWSSKAEVTGVEGITIGRPIANTQIYIIDENLTLLPIGVPGELCIAGEGVGKGYLNQPQLTAKRFVPNPYATEANHHGRIMYRTGDQARWREDGEIEYLGRIDTQVKIRGLRIELGEIESVMSTFPGIVLCAASAQKDENGRQFLVGYYVTAQEDLINEKKLRSHLAAKLPSYMVPNCFVKLDIMPMTPSGKIDRKNLPLLDFSASLTEYIAPRTKMEKALALVWKELLHIERVGCADDFFALGGDSLLAISMIGEIEKQYGKRLSVGDIFKHSILEEMARILTQSEQSEHIVSANVTRFRLLPQQKAIYAAYMKEPDSLVYNVSARIPLTSETDREKLIQCMKDEVAAQRVLNCTIEVDGDELYAVYESQAELQIERIETGKESSFYRAFDLQKAPLVHVGLTESALLFDIHHIVADGASLNILLRNVMHRYAGEIVRESGLWYGDYAEFYQSLSQDVHRTFWKELWKVDPEPIQLPKSESGRIGGQSFFSHIPQRIISDVRDYSKKRGLTQTMVFLGAYGILLARYSGRLDLVSSIILQNRLYTDTKDLVGMFVNTLPVQFAVRGAVTDYLERMKLQLLGLYEHQEFPLPEIERTIGLTDRSTINTAFVYQGNGEKILKLNEKSIVPEFVDTGTHKFDILLELTPTNDGCCMRIEYDSAKYDEKLIESLAEGFQKIVSQIVGETIMDISEISVLSVAETKGIVEGFNETYVEYPRNKCIHELFTEQAKKTPDNIALVFEERAITYHELDEMSNSLAHFLREKGIGRNDVVPLISRRDWRVIVAMLGILKAGGAYMPVSPDYPKERIETMIGIAKSKIAICCGYDEELSIKKVDQRDFDYTSHSTAVENTNNPEDLCYIIFTSGSTGEPKGIMQTHRCLANLMTWGKKYIIEGRRVMASTNLIFDVAVQEIASSLLGGGCLYLTNDEVKYNYIEYLNYIDDKSIDMIYMTPSYLKILGEWDRTKILQKVNHIFLAGEDIRTVQEMLTELFNKTIISNQYGPAETHVVTEKIINEKNAITIGRPIANTQIYILDENLMPLPIGVAGEICISGEGVGKGYLNQPELTKERFVPNPFATEKNRHGKIMYRTGDLARWREDGEIEYLGRIDTQVKTRGLRIELGEIESVMSTFPGIVLCAASAQKDENGRQYLVGYYVSEQEDVINEKELRSHLAAKLPSYMVPNCFVKLDTMPMTPSGKTDRKNLPLPDFSASLTEYVAPRTKTEVLLCEIIKEVLGRGHVGVTDDFFELGGDSLSAIAVVAKAGEKGCHIPLQKIFDYPTVQALCQFLENGDAKKKEPQEYGIPEDTDLWGSGYEKYAQLLTVNGIEQDSSSEKESLGNVFLTGATGFLGAHVLDALMQLESGKIYCLVRSMEREDRRGRLSEILNYYFDDKYEDEIGKRIIPVVGDIEKKGLSEEVPDDVQTVIHTAATVKHYGAKDYFQTVNVGGTRNVTEYALSIGAKLIHISTTGVSGNSLADRFEIAQITEEIHFDETCFYLGQPLSNVYVRSKFEAERVVMDAILEKGLDAKIVRVGNLTNRYRDLKFQPNYESNAFLKRVKAFLSLGFFPVTLLPLYAEFSPVDETADGIVKIAEYAKEQNVFHLYSNKPLYFEAFLGLLKKFGIPMEVIGEEGFLKAVESTRHEPGKEFIYETLQSDLDENGKLRYESNIHVENDFTMRFLNQTGFSWSEINERYIRGYIEYFRGLG